MLTQAELNALAQLLQRTPMTQAEFLKAQEMIANLQADIPTPPEKKQEAGEKSADVEAEAEPEAQAD